MNCKRGDLAIVVRSYNPKNIGKVCQCIRAVKLDIVGPGGKSFVCDCWETDTNFETFDGQQVDKFMEDMNLKPLRDTDGEDEMLSIAGKPPKKKIVAKPAEVVLK